FPERTSPVLLQIPFVCTNCPQKFSGLDLIFKYFSVQINRVPIDQNSSQVQYQIFYHSYRSITIVVNRLSHTWRFLSSLISILQTWTVRPIRMGVPRPGTRPSFADRRWLALISIPTTLRLSVSSSKRTPAMLPRVSANATEAPPCR